MICDISCLKKSIFFNSIFWKKLKKSMLFFLRFLYSFFRKKNGIKWNYGSKKSIFFNSIFGKNIVTEVKKIEEFYYAEDYHQDFEKKNPYNPYVQNVSIPRFKKFKKKSSNYVKIKDDHK